MRYTNYSSETRLKKSRTKLSRFGNTAYRLDKKRKQFLEYLP